MTKTPTIFVQIAAYRDEECLPTVADIFKKATHPDRITVGICWQYDKETEAPFTYPERESQVRVLNVDIRETEGPCWARRQTQTLWQDEDYTLQLDSHMRFIPEWDRVLLVEIAQCPSPKPVISCLPAKYIPPDNLQENPRPTVNGVKPWSKDFGVRGRGAFLAKSPEKPLNGAFICAGFLFAPTSIIQEVPYDPYLYFSEEEPSYAARLWTSGWDIFSATQTVVYHFYNVGEHKGKRTLHWDDHKERYAYFRRRSRSRFRHLFGIENCADQDMLAELDKYHLGTQRSLADYEAYCGVDYKNETVSERALRCEFIDGLANHLNRPKLYVPELDDPPES